MDFDWRSVRAEFPSLANWTFLNTATFGQLPRRAVEAVNRHFARETRQIWTHRFSSAVNHMAGGAFPFAKEELFTRRAVARYRAFRGGRVQRVDESGEGIELISG